MASKCKPMRRGSLIWRYTRLAFACGPALAKAVAKSQSMDYEEAGQKEWIEGWRESIFEGLSCSPEDRRDALGWLAAIPIFLFAAVSLTMFGFLLVGVAVGSDWLGDAAGWILVTGVMYLFGLVCQFCFRWFFAELDLKRHVKGGGQGVFTPSGLSQPKSRDFFYPLPLTLYMVAMMLITQARP
jgi:hypothetical protein